MEGWKESGVGEKRWQMAGALAEACLGSGAVRAVNPLPSLVFLRVVFVKARVWSRQGGVNVGVRMRRKAEASPPVE
jgi:hypothetical protein